MSGEVIAPAHRSGSGAPGSTASHPQRIQRLTLPAAPGSTAPAVLGPAGHRATGGPRSAAAKMRPHRSRSARRSTAARSIPPAKPTAGRLHWRWGATRATTVRPTASSSRPTRIETSWFGAAISNAFPMRNPRNNSEGVEHSSKPRIARMTASLSHARYGGPGGGTHSTPGYSYYTHEPAAW